MKRLLVSLALLFAVPCLSLGCSGPAEPAQATPEELEQHRQEMVDVSNRERGG